MAFYDTTWYCNAGDQSTTGYYAVTKWAASTAVAAGVLRRQLAVPTVGNERVFACIVAGTTGGSEPAWTLTRGAKTTDGTATWQEVTGMSAVNGDLTNTVNWTAAKAIGTPTLGAIIQRNSGASYWICSTAGTLGASEPSWPNNTAGTTQADGTTTWTCLGVVGNFTGGQAPHARLANACTSTWFVAGNTIYVGDNHAESQASSMGIAPSTSGATMSQIICHNHSGSYPPTSSDLRITATVSTTGATGDLTFNVAGQIYVYGIAFLCAVGSSSGNGLYIGGSNAYNYFDACLFKLAATGVGGLISLNNSATSACIWNNCTVYFGNAGQFIVTASGSFRWQNTGPILASGSAVPSGFLGQTGNGRCGDILLEALDLNQLTGNFVNQTAATYTMGNWLIKDCKLNAAASIATPLAYGQTIQLVRCDSTATAYKSARYQYEGTETTETSITRVGGAADPTGQAQSRKIVTTANSQWLRPFRAEPYAIWNAVTGANVTVTVCGTINAGALPNNNDIWLEVEYLGSSATPLGTIVTTTKSSVLAAGAAVASDGSSWNNAVSTFVTLNGTPIGVTMSNGNLTATHPTTPGPAGVYSLASKTTGKYYFEATFSATTSTANCAAIMLAGASFTDLVTNGTNCTAVYQGLGAVWSNNANTTKAIGAIVAGDVIGIAIDLTARLGWFRKGSVGNWNGDPTANPATGVGGVIIAAAAAVPAVGFGTATSINDSITMNLGASAFIGTVPLGFSPGWGDFFTPFKLTTTLSSPQPGMPGYIHARVRAAKVSTTYYIDPQIVLS